ncbi:Stk1 family PASTA domain-containing Ser/Thr kinase [Allosaccharopolyspora coralli]|uniref:non-specific serine/threonine protein kinase n=1 Tax=Allosaccharopolyspora coralli TaxID=2665642 RepID=A0A5Q3Q0P7_9PSEU|nr:Stk1 family PASTA domain-containing Ser/Thr kinase [Allosaccharopolyspora coralli]QGK68198.1 Stk1 family PASTA domain-containing Ser/Thr kinase [Allosaccharopolyspora coralli]
MSSPRLLSNRYEIGDTLGYGGMSEVHRGRDVRLGRDVAVKVLRADLASDPTFQLRFRREAQNAAALNHPAIVAVYDTGETDVDGATLPYIVMEYVDGRTLRDIVKSEGPLPPRRAMEVMADASAALDFSHRHGIVHRDVKPANIMITRSGAVKVMDFGIARALADGQAAVTQTAAVIGTAQYLSPEQARGESVDGRSDVYAAGCVLFELLTGEPPFTGDSPVAVAYQHVREDPRKPSDLNAQVPASLDAVVLKALSKNPANRYQSTAEMRSDLVRVLSGQRPKAPLVMSEEERTSMMAAPAAATEVVPGRHRPDALADSEEDYAYEQERKRKRRKNGMIALVTLLCVGAFALVAWAASLMFSGADEAERLPVPNFMNMTEQAATLKVNNEGWNVPQWNQCPSTKEQSGRVVQQDPQGGTLIPKTQPINLCVGSGPRQIQVPDLSGKTVEEADSLLRDVGLELSPVTKDQETENQNEIGKIVAQSAEGTAEEGTTIVVTLGIPVREVSVPDVTDQPFDAAKATLEGAGFTVNREETDSTEPANTVLEQNPTSGTTVRPGSPIKLTVSNGEQITMPSVRGMNERQAQQALRQAGWNGQISTTKRPVDDFTMINKVVESQPTEGSPISKNQSITLFIGSLDAGSSTTSPEDDDDGGLFPFPN